MLPNLESILTVKTTIMMMKAKYIVVYEDSFKRELKKLSDTYQKMVLKKLKILESNPYYPSLRTKKMESGTGYYESSINMDIRILWYFKENSIIVLTDVGHHDVLKKY